mgnify:CR=1 FL=1
MKNDIPTDEGRINSHYQKLVSNNSRSASDGGTPLNL